MSKFTKQGTLTMLERKVLTAALVAVGLFTSLEYKSVAQSNQPATQPSPGTTGPNGTTTQPSPGTTRQNGTTTQPSPGTTDQNQTQLSAVDRQFMTEAAQMGMAEVELSQLATKRAASKEVRQFAQEMIQEHTQANKQLMQLAAQKSVTLPKEMDAIHQALRDRLGQLSGQQFDQEYMNAMLTDHVASVALFQNETQLGQNADVKAYAAKLLPTLQEHLQDVRQLTDNASTGSTSTSPTASPSPSPITSP